jgi:hypothetical protein
VMYKYNVYNTKWVFLGYFYHKDLIDGFEFIGYNQPFSGECNVIFNGSERIVSGKMYLKYMGMKDE